MKKIFLVISVSILLFAVSCSVGPDYVRPDIEIPEAPASNFG